MTPGHSSIPPKETAIGVLAKAVSALETNPHPSMFGHGPEMDFFSYISSSVNHVDVVDKTDKFNQLFDRSRQRLGTASCSPTCGFCHLYYQSFCHVLPLLMLYKEQRQPSLLFKEDTRFYLQLYTVKSRYESFFYSAQCHSR